MSLLFSEVLFIDVEALPFMSLSLCTLGLLACSRAFRSAMIFFFLALIDILGLKSHLNIDFTNVGRRPNQWFATKR